VAQAARFTRSVRAQPWQPLDRSGRLRSPPPGPAPRWSRSAHAGSAPPSGHPSSRWPGDC